MREEVIQGVRSREVRDLVKVIIAERVSFTKWSNYSQCPIPEHRYDAHE